MAVAVGLVMERFPVYVQPTEASERCAIRGALQLVVYTRGVGVARIGDVESFLMWPIIYIRQYKHESLKNNNNIVTNDVHVLNAANAISLTDPLAQVLITNGFHSSETGKKSGKQKMTLVSIEVGR